MDENVSINEQQEEQQQEEKLFTQAEVDAIINKRMARAAKKQQQVSDEDMAAFREWQNSQKPKEDTDRLKSLSAELDDAKAELEMARREKFLLKSGVDAEDVDYYVYKISKGMDNDADFEDAAKKYLKDHKQRVRVDMGARLSGNASAKTANEAMNTIIRNAGK